MPMWRRSRHLRQLTLRPHHQVGLVSIVYDVDFAVSELRRKTGINYVFDETTRVSVPI